MNAFRDDVAALIPQLRAFARSLAHGQPDLADDLVQDTLVRALRAEHQFTPGTNLRAWLFTILRNRFRTEMSGRRPTQPIDDPELEHLLWVPAAQEKAVEFAAFRRAFGELSEPQREALVLAGLYGLPYEEIAAICSCEVGTVKSRVNRARARLRALLLEDGMPLKPSSDGSFERMVARFAHLDVRTGQPVEGDAAVPPASEDGAERPAEHVPLN